MRLYFYTLYTAASLAFLSIASLEDVPSAGAKLSILLAVASFLALVGAVSPADGTPAESESPGRR